MDADRCEFLNPPVNKRSEERENETNTEFEQMRMGFQHLFFRFFFFSPSLSLCPSLTSCPSSTFHYIIVLIHVLANKTNLKFKCDVCFWFACLCPNIALPCQQLLSCFGMAASSKAHPHPLHSLCMWMYALFIIRR